MRARAVALVAAALLAGCTSGSTPRPVEAGSSRIVYRVVETSTDVAQTTTVVTDLAGPYRARTLTYPGTSTTGPASGFAWDEGGVYAIRADGSVAESEVVGPGFAGPFDRLDLALPVALRQHLVSLVGPGTVAGRACTRWLSQLPLDGAPLSAPTAGDRTESCVDPRGRLLGDTWQVSGRVVRTRTVTALGAGPSLAGEGLFGGQRPALLASGSSGYVVHASTPAELSRLMQIRVPAGPVGLRADRAAAVLDVDPARQGFSRETAVLTWTGPGRLAVLRLERRLTAGSGATVRGAPVDLGALGTGRLEPVLAGLRVTADGPNGIRVVATADLPEAELLAWLRSLQLVG